MTVLVIDTSITMAWCFEDEATNATDAVLDRLQNDEAAVPSIWPLEIANVLLVAERRGRLTAAKTTRFVNLLDQLPVRIEETPGVDRLIPAGRSHGLSAYDAAFLVLAERLGAPLAPLDQRLAKAAGDVGVQLLVEQ